MTKKINLTLSALSCGISLALPLTAHSALEEILVTAQKRTESVQDVPIAINALAGDLLDDLGVSDTDDIEALYPNLSTNNSSAVNSGFAIRGVGTNNFHISGQQSVGTNIDDVAAVSPFISAIGVFDMERVEVLRGPQNTLYGRNTTGGTLNFHTRQANVADGFNGRGALTMGNGGTVEFEGALGFNLSDNLAGRVAIMDKSFDGIFENLVDGKKVGGNDKNGARINLVWDVSDATTAKFTFATGESEGDSLVRRSVGNLSPDGATPCAANASGEAAMTSGRNNCWTAIQQSGVDGSDYLSAQLAAGNSDLIIANPNSATNGTSPWLVNYSTEWGKTYKVPEDEYKAEFDGFRVKLVHDFDSMQLNWLSSYDETAVTSGNARNLTGFSVFQDAEFEVWQHELRLSSIGDGSLRWLGGFYYSTQESQEDTWVHRTDGAGGAGVSPAILIDSEYDAWSVYGQLDYDLSDTWSLTAGVRHTDDKLEGDTQKWVCTPGQTNGPTFTGANTYDRNYRFANCNDISATLADTNPTQELSELGWKVGLNWNAGDDTLIYGSVSEGFKGGAYDNRALANGQQPIGPEFLTAYELGIKTELLDSTLQINASVYLYEWEDLQIFGTEPGGAPAQVNVPETELKGAEVEVKWSPNDSLYVQAGIGLSDTEITDATDPTGALGNIGILGGNSVTNAPDTTANLLIVNTVPLESGELVLQSSYRWTSESYFISANQHTERSEKESHGWLNARITYNFGDDLQHSVALWGNNLTEEKSCAYLPQSLPGNINWNCQIGDTGVQMWGLTAETNF